MRVRCAMGVLALASVVLLGAVGSARAADKWIELGKLTLKSTEGSATIKGEKGKLFKEDVKATRLTVQGGDVEISKVILSLEQSPRRHHRECRSHKGGRTNESEGCSSTRGDPQLGDDRVQDPQQCTDGHRRTLGIRLSGV